MSLLSLSNVHFLIEEVGPLLVEAAAKSTVVLLLAWAFVVLTRRRSAAHRHMALSLAMALTLAMPLLARIAPTVPIPFPSGGRDLLSSAQVAGSGQGVSPASSLIADFPVEHGASAVEGSLNKGLPPNPSQDAARAEVSPLDAVRGLGPGRSIPRSGMDHGVEAGTAAGSQRIPFSSAALFLAWAFGALAAGTTLAVNLSRLHRIRRDAEPITMGPVREAAVAAADRLGLGPVPSLLRGTGAGSPLTWGIFRPVILLPPQAEEWEAWRLEAVLVHEMGHIKRRDYLSQLVAQVACAAYWFNPLVWMGAHKMWIEREYACDDLVLSAGMDGTRYADDLLFLARALRPAHASGAMAFGMARAGRLRNRLMAILDEERSRAPLTVRGLVGTGALALLAATLVATLSPAEARAGEEGMRPAMERPVLRGEPGRSDPAPEQSRQELYRTLLCGPADGEAHKRASLTNDGVRFLEAEYGACRSSVRIEGDIRFTEDFSAVAWLSSGSLLRIDVDRGSSSRYLEIRPGAGGQLRFVWRVDGESKDFGPDGEEWLAGVLLEIFRSSNYMAEERAAWILAQEGAEGVIREVERMLADYAKAAYLTILVERGELGQDQVTRVIQVAGREIESDHSLGQVLLATASRYPFDDQTQAAFLGAAVSLESDHTQGQVFLRALSKEGLSDENIRTLLETAAETIESDHTLGTILQDLASRYALNAHFRVPFMQAAGTLESDHTAGQVYSILLDQDGLSPAELGSVLDAARRIDSDHTLGRLLERAAAKHDLSDPALRAAFLGAAQTIESDHTLGSVYQTALELGGLSEPEMASILEAAGGIESDHTLAQLLLGVVRQGLPGSALQRSLLQTASRIESDHSLASVLVAFAEKYPVEGEVRDAFLETMEGIQSQHSRDQVARAMGGDT